MFERPTSCVLLPMLALALALAGVGCGDEAPAEAGEEPLVLNAGKGDHVGPEASIEFDETDPRWERVTECKGFDLCLPSIVASRDRSGEPDTPRSYPTVRVLDEIFPADNLQVSPNCDGRLGFASDGSVGCIPEDGEPFLFGLFSEEGASSENPWAWVEFDYDTPARARLFKDTEATGAGLYYLDIADQRIEDSSGESRPPE